MRLIQLIINLLVVVLPMQAFSQVVCDARDYDFAKGPYRISEKIILETDREIYMVGEEINLACYLYEPALQKPLDLSKVVYIEFFTSGNLIIEQIKMEIIQGCGDGYIRIPKKLSSGKYYLRAYTNYMKNFGYAGFAYSSVTVLNPFQKPDNAYLNGGGTSSLQVCTLYPEGGHIVCGHNNKIVCELSDNQGNPVAGTVRVLEDDNHLISTFVTNSYGVGYFTIKPLPHNRYKLDAAAGSTQIEKNIETEENSVVLIKKFQNQDEVQLGLLRDHFTDYPLRLELRFSGTSVLLSTLCEEDSVVSIPLRDLPKGIIQLQLKNSRNELLSSRNIYNPSIRKAEIQLNTNKKEYGNREKVELNIECSDETLRNLVLTMSVFLTEPATLTSHIKSDNQEFLQSALYPFLGSSCLPVCDLLNDSLFLDLVLMTGKSDLSTQEGPSEPAYDDLAFFPENKDDLVFGRVVDENGMPVTFSPVLQSWIDTVCMLQAGTTDGTGRFYFKSDRKGNNKLVMTLDKKTGGRIILQDEFFPEFFSPAKEYIVVDSSDINVLRQQMLNLQISDSYAEQKEDSMRIKRIPFYVSADKTFYMNDFVPLSTLEEFLFEIVPDIRIDHIKDSTIIRIQHPLVEMPIGDHPLFLVDGMPVLNSTTIAGLSCSDLLSIGIVYEKYFLQSMYFDGILDIHTKEGNASALKIPDGLSSVNYTGIQEIRTEHGYNASMEEAREPLFKTQLYWNPSIILNKSGKATIAFMTPDNNGHYLVRCSLKTPDGSISNYYTTFQIQ